MTSTGQLVGIVDDDPSVRRGLQRLFKSAGYLAERFASAEDYLERETFAGPVCLVVDMRMPGLNGLELQAALETRGASEQIIFLTGHGDVPSCTTAMKHGAVDFLLKPFVGDELLRTVAHALAHSADRLREQTERRDARRQIERLTAREFEVMRFVICGLLNKQIAAELNTAEKTIKVHRGRVMQKLGVASVPELVRISQQAGVAPAPPGYRTKVH